MSTNSNWCRESLVRLLGLDSNTKTCKVFHLCHFYDCAFVLCHFWCGRTSWFLPSPSLAIVPLLPAFAVFAGCPSCNDTSPATLSSFSKVVRFVMYCIKSDNTDYLNSQTNILRQNLSKLLLTIFRFTLNLVGSLHHHPHNKDATMSNNGHSMIHFCEGTEFSFFYFCGNKLHDFATICRQRMSRAWPISTLKAVFPA